MPTGVGTVIRDIETAIDLAWRGWVTNYRIKKVELTLHAEVTNRGGVGVKFEIPNLPFDGSIDVSEVSLQKLCLVLEPPASPVEFQAAIAPIEIEDAVREAVAAIRSALDELRTSRAFNMPEASLHLKFTTSKEGKIAILTGHFSRKRVLTHDLVLHIGL